MPKPESERKLQIQTRLDIQAFNENSDIQIAEGVGQPLCIAPVKIGEENRGPFKDIRGCCAQFSFDAVHGDLLITPPDKWQESKAGAQNPCTEGNFPSTIP